MATTRRNSDAPKKPRQPPATTPEARENQLVALAMDAAEKQIREGTASSQIMTHFLKQASPREKLERQKLEAENEMLRKKVEAYTVRCEQVAEDLAKDTGIKGEHDVVLVAELGLESQRLAALYLMKAWGVADAEYERGRIADSGPS